MLSLKTTVKRSSYGHCVFGAACGDPVAPGRSHDVAELVASDAMCFQSLDRARDTCRISDVTTV